MSQKSSVPQAVSFVSQVLKRDMLLLEPSSFSFITRPTKRCLRVVRKHVGTMERFGRVNALEPGSPCGFHIWLSHLLLLCQSLMPAVGIENPERGRGASPGVPELVLILGKQRYTARGIGDAEAASPLHGINNRSGMGVPWFA